MTKADELRESANELAEWSFVEAPGATSQVLVSDLNRAGRLARDWLRMDQALRKRESKGEDE